MAGNDTLSSQQEALADEAFANYGFGEGITVVDTERWGRDTFDGQDDWTRLVYVKCDDADEDTSHQVSFHAKFKEETPSLEDAYAYWMDSGSVIGAPGTASDGVRWPIVAPSS